MWVCDLKTSVIIALFNGHKYIEEQLLSIINQTVMLDEVIIIDDCSTDNSVDIVSKIMKQYPNFNIKQLKNKSNLGVTRTFERGISLSNGDLIFFSDQDDVWFNNKVEIFLDYAQNYPEINLFYSDGFIVDSELNEITAISKHYKWELYEKLSRRIQMSIDLRNFIPGCTISLRNEFAQKYLPIPEKIFNIHDGWYANLSHFESSNVYIPLKLIKYRQHETNQIGIQQRLSVITKLKNHFELKLAFDSMTYKCNEYFELLKISKFTMEIENNLLVRYNYFKSVIDSLNNNIFIDRHFNFTYMLLKSHIFNAKYRQVIQILKIEIILFLKLNFKNR